MTRGFLQIAGFTFGKATSFFDIYPGASFAYNAGHVFTPDTGDAGKMLAAYTAQFGNGFSATISVEQNRRSVVAGVGGLAVPLPLGGLYAQDAIGSGINAGIGIPDIVGNIRVDQAWGSVLVGAAIHDVSADYYNLNQIGVAGTAGTTGAGHPDDKIGWAVTGGFIFNLPMIAPGDRFSAQAVYTEGALRYAAITPSGAGLLAIDGNNIAFGNWTDGVYGGGVGQPGFPGVFAPTPGPADHGLELLGGVRALLDPGSADVRVRVVH